MIRKAGFWLGLGKGREIECEILVEVRVLALYSTSTT